MGQKMSKAWRTLTSGGGLTIDDLPDPLLGRVLVLAGRKQGSAVTLVSKRWQQVFYSEPDLWRTFHLPPALPTWAAERDRDHQVQQAWLVNKQRVLRRVAGLVRRMEIADASATQQAANSTSAAGWHLGQFLDLLQPGLLTDMELLFETTLPLAALFVLRRFPRLTSLALGGSKAELSLTTPRVLAKLTQLHSLRCLSAQLTEPLVTSMLGMTRLTQLTICSSQAPLPPAACQVSQLAQLRSLHIHAPDLPEAVVDGIVRLAQLERLELGAPGALPRVRQLTRLSRLQHLSLTESSAPVHEPGTELPGSAELPAPASFGGKAGLRSYHFETQRPFQLAVLNPEAAGAQLHKCAYGASSSISSQAGPVAGKLEVWDGKNITALQPLLAALLPAGRCPATLTLELQHVDLQAAALQGCAQLAAVSELDLYSCRSADDSSSGADGDLGAALAALVQPAAAAGRLTSLTIMRSLGGQFPACIAGLTGLRKLVLSNNQLTEVLDGPYLAGLEELKLFGNRLQSRPPALAAATSLRPGSLAVGGNPFWRPGTIDYANMTFRKDI